MAGHTAQRFLKYFLNIKISSENVTKSAGNCCLGRFTEETLNRKLHFLCSTYG